MMKKLLTLITASFMLAAPNIHAMAGYNFHFDKPKTKSVPFDAYISSMMSDEIRASREYRDEIYHMKKMTNNSAFVICSKDNIDENYGVLAQTNSIGFPRFHLAFITLNENVIKKQSPHTQTYVLAHELTHAKNNDGGELIAWTVLSQLLPFSKHVEQKFQSLYTQYKENKSETIRTIELLADTGAYETMAECGYRKALEHQLESYKSSWFTVYPRGENYPTTQTYISLIGSALLRCRQDIDPQYTQDSANLMRNSPETKPISKPISWSEMLFGKKS